MGINRLSKSFNGSISSTIPAVAIIILDAVFLLIKNEHIKIAKKQLNEPATVLPYIKGIFIRPSIFPEILAIPSPKARDKIPIV